MAIVVTILLAPGHVYAQQVYWGSFVNNAPFLPSLMDQFEADTGKKQSIVHWGEPWILKNEAQPFQADQAEIVRLRGSIPMINWDSWKLGSSDVNRQGLGPGAITLADIIDGSYDAYITQWATAAKAWGHPFFLRFDHELNGYWYPWSEQLNGNKPGDFVKAWRHVHDIFSRVGATNATWVWCVNIADVRTTPLAEVYPGDQYVDWTAVDGYNKATDTASWLPFASIFGQNPWGHHNTYQDLLTVAPSKPIMVGEVATTDSGGDPAAWIRDAFTVQLPQHFSAVKAVVWFNWDGGVTSKMAYQIETTSAKQASFRQAIGSSYYASNTFANLPPGPIKPLSNTFTLVDVGDSYVDGANPNSTAGGPSLTLLANGYHYRVPFLRFDLGSLAGRTITSATLKVRTSTAAGSGSAATFNIQYVASNTWNGATMSMNNSVPISTTRLGTLPASTSGTWNEASLTVAPLQGKGLVSMAIVNQQTTDGLVLYSKEGDPANVPQLVVTVQ
jgi:mannan endo-1,4-beta-mannosidase